MGITKRNQDGFQAYCAAMGLGIEDLILVFDLKIIEYSENY